MKISYTVEVGEIFSPPQHGLEPDNYDADKHDVMIVLVSGKEQLANLDWIKAVNYVLRKKKVRTSKFCACCSKGFSVHASSKEEAWNRLWYKKKATKFVVEHVYEDDILIDIIVHKDPKG